MRRKFFLYREIVFINVMARFMEPILRGCIRNEIGITQNTILEAMMPDTSEKRIFVKHAKSSAAAVSIAIHLLLVVIAASLVAVTVVTKDETRFAARPVQRPRLKLKKLQVPVKMEKKKMRRPKLRKRIVVQPRIKENISDIKMPEVVGIKGGIGTGAAGGIGLAGGIGFNIPEISLFGVKSKGEKIFFALDSSDAMMYDEIGGIPAYAVIKAELIGFLSQLNSMVLFNVAVYDASGTLTRFPSLVPASPANVAKVEEWLETLNSFRKGMGDRDYGLRTLGPGGVRFEGKLAAAPIKHTSVWSTSAVLAMEQQADTVFILTQGWGAQFHTTAPAKPWDEKKKAKWTELERKADLKLKEENDKRREKGMPPRVLSGWALVKTYFPDAETPPEPERHWYTPEELAQGLAAARASAQTHTPTSSGMLRMRKGQKKVSLNIIHFIRKDHQNENDQKRFKRLVSLVGGSYKTLSGLDAIRGAASSGDSP